MTIGPDPITRIRFKSLRLGMKLLHILNDGPGELSTRIIEAQTRNNEVEVIDLSREDLSYDAVIDAVFSCDKVVSW